MVKYSEFSEEKKDKCRKAHREWAKRNPRNSYYKDYDTKRSLSRVPSRMITAAKARAKASDLPFSISLEDIVIPQHCPICLCEMKMAEGVRGGAKDSPTLDRVICELGYTPENIAVICKNCNSKKGHATSQELRRIADWIDAQTG